MKSNADKSIHLFRWKCFQKDWPAFQKTNEYKRLVNCLLQAGIKQLYADNILYRAFYSGYFNEPFIKD
jgi:hypothetical protein